MEGLLGVSRRESLTRLRSSDFGLRRLPRRILSDAILECFAQGNEEEFRRAKQPDEDAGIEVDD